ncbi:MAG: hypothetical protein ACI9XP_001885 [Lentimonas sp.]|jgi:hypothetical protein
MKKLPFIALAIVALTACKKPEIIPAPGESITLKGNYNAVINGENVEWTKNVNGYAIQSEQTAVLQAGTTISDYTFSSGFFSTTAPSSIMIKLGTLSHDESVSPEISSTAFEGFFNANTSPQYGSGEAGFFIEYTNEAGRKFISEASNPGSVEFVDLELVNDDQDVYMTYKCNFSGPLVSREADTLNVIMDASLTGWFRK